MKICDFFLIRKIFFFFVLKCKQKENVHNLNRRWAPCKKICVIGKEVKTNLYI